MFPRMLTFSWRSWKPLWLLAVALPVLAAPEEGRFLANVRQLTFEGKSGEAYFSPEGTELIFQSVREPGNPFYQIYLLNLASGDLRRLSPGVGKTTCGFFRPGSGEALFASTHLDPESPAKQKQELDFIASGQTRRYAWDYDEQMDVFAVQRDGSNLRRLTTSPGYDAEAAYSPDGRQIVFTSLRSAFPLTELSPAERKLYETDPAFFGEIYIMNADGSEPKRLTHQPGYDGGPFFSPDGARIIWRRFETNGLTADIFSMRTDGSEVRRLTRFDSMSWAPFPHPLGRYVVFTSNKHGFENFELFIVDHEGRGEPVRVSFTDGFDGLPVFSPGGQKICWTSKRSGESQLFLADWNHAEALQAVQDSIEKVEKAGKVHKVVDEANQAVAARLAGARQAEIRADEARRHVEVLASDDFAGRKTGEPGAAKAAEYLARELAMLDLKPAGSLSNFHHEFQFTAGVKADPTQTSLEFVPGKMRVLEEDFRPLSFSANGQFEGPVVFAGYGLAVPGKLGEEYDSYSGLDVSNKVVLVLRYVPENVDPARRQVLNRYAALRYKAMLARERGAKAILFVTGPNSPNSGQLIPLSSDGTLAGSEILAASLSEAAASDLLAASGKKLGELQTGLDSENPHAEKGLALTNSTARLRIQLEHQRLTDRNVVALLPGQTAEYVMIGAHYDHLGFGESGGSREHQEEQGQIHNGADDNASGVAAVLELAAHFAAEPAPLKRGLIFAFWSGEEMGLLGSSAFAERPPVPLTNIAAYLNFDMVGRLRDNKLTLQGLGSSKAWARLIERRNVAAGFNLNTQEDPYLPTDTTAFYPKGLPVLSFFTGSHDDYHRPTDDIDTVHYEGIERIARFAALLVRDLALADSPPAYAKVEKSSAPGSRDALRVYLGTIPDYATEVKGVKLSGVRGGSPAEKAGLKSGDILVEFAGQKVANIYDYTYALDAAKIGQPLLLKILRADQPLEITVTPEARR